MSPAVDQDDLPAILARAFVQAWHSYYLPERRDAISEEIARPALAKHLVAMAKKGLNEEVSLATAGLQYLSSLTPGHLGSGIARTEESEILDEPSDRSTTFRSRSLHLDGQKARFLVEWRIPWMRGQA
jgi:hypothetical protein